MSAHKVFRDDFLTDDGWMVQPNVALNFQVLKHVGKILQYWHFISMSLKSAENLSPSSVPEMLCIYTLILLVSLLMTPVRNVQCTYYDI